MRFFLDENFPRDAFGLLTGLRHEVGDARDSGLSGADDKDIFRMAQESYSVILTTDRDFFHTIPHLGEKHYGIVVIALHQPNTQKILRRIEWFLENFNEIDLKNMVFEIRDQTYVVYSSSSSEPENS